MNGHDKTIYAEVKRQHPEWTRQQCRRWLKEFHRDSKTAEHLHKGALKPIITP